MISGTGILACGSSHTTSVNRHADTRLVQGLLCHHTASCPCPTHSLLEAPKVLGKITRNVENEKFQIEEQKDLLKTFVDGDEEVMYSFLVAMELYICKELRKGISKFDKVMKKLWESDIISEDVADRWHGNEQALHEFYPEFQLEDAIAIRESGLKFVEWVREEGRYG